MVLVWNWLTSQRKKFIMVHAISARLGTPPLGVVDGSHFLHTYLQVMNDSYLQV